MGSLCASGYSGPVPRHKEPVRHVQEILNRYAELVRAYATRLNLVSSDDLDRFEERHIKDSLRVLPLLERSLGGPCVDVGSGAGLPGIPLAAASPDRMWRLIEPRRKRSGFLEEAVRELGLDNVEVLAVTAEQAAGDPLLARGHVFAVARALAAPEVALDLLVPLVQAGGMAATFLGERAVAPLGSEAGVEGVAIVRVNGVAEEG